MRAFESGRDISLERPRGGPPSPRLRLYLAGIAVALVATAALLVLQLAQH